MGFVEMLDKSRSLSELSRTARAFLQNHAITEKYNVAGEYIMMLLITLLADLTR